ncbi:MAG: shikimate dehydrogenase [Gemmataceae bacterium]|nr:shikimate dehydrogenase [Gemmataceae bacterium]
MEQTTRICAVIGRTRHKMMQMEIQEATKRGARMIELRLDFLSKPPDFKRLMAVKSCPLVATVRRVEDGGRWSRSEEERIVLLRQAIVSGFDWVDLETDIADSVRPFGKVQRIVSYHNLRETPADLEQIFETMCKQDADVLKVAVTAQKTSDNIRVLKLLKDAPKPTVALCMGDLGACTRVLNVVLGSPFTYAAFNKERNIAPGILSFMDLKKIYGLDSVGPESKVFGVLGDPVGHSLSPLIHNAGFRKLKQNAVYVPFRVPRGELESFLKEFDSIPVQGYSVTIPHKEGAARVAGERDASVETTGAANTLLRKSGGGWKAANTDTPAAIDSLKANLPKNAEGGTTPLSQRTVLILGAGGVARAIAHGLQREGAQVMIANRTSDRAHDLAAEVGCKHVEWDGRMSVVCDTLVNCTAVGMHPNVDESPIHHSFLKSGLFVFDTIYNPETTMLIREAEERGCHVLTGVDMFVRQAGLQFRMFTGKEPPLEAMTDLVRRTLSPLNYAKQEEGGES